jgi:hypothetical protein
VIRSLLFAASILAGGWMLDRELEWAKEPKRVAEPVHIRTLPSIRIVEPE